MCAPFWDINLQNGTTNRFFLKFSNITEIVKSINPSKSKKKKFFHESNTLFSHKYTNLAIKNHTTQNNKTCVKQKYFDIFPSLDDNC